MTQLLGTKDDRAILHRNAHSRDRVAVAKCSDLKYNRSRLASRHTSPLGTTKRRPGTTSGAPGESHNSVAALFTLGSSIWREELPVLAFPQFRGGKRTARFSFGLRPLQIVLAFIARTVYRRKIRVGKQRTHNRRSAILAPCSYVRVHANRLPTHRIPATRRTNPSVSLFAMR